MTLPIITRKFRNFALIKIFYGALVAQSVERVLGKDEVGGSNPLEGSIQTSTLTFTISKDAQPALI